ncbi:hypothetical protein QR680_016946 [Steinernema hermaphroditum]|uniref:Uncharacterized protein n=1 Tax=Steinernema hermaphroditum TaxID=289476 RepID=A0AA39LMS6_9BILA|nr:hypothetical protein QR680_016946 [Steinernema hermaphroditum]
MNQRRRRPIGGNSRRHAPQMAEDFEQSYYASLSAEQLFVGILLFAFTPVILTLCYCCSLVCVVWCLVRKRRRREEEDLYRPQRSYYTPGGSFLRLERYDSMEVQSEP